MSLISLISGSRCHSPKKGHHKPCLSYRCTKITYVSTMCKVVIVTRSVIHPSSMVHLSYHLLSTHYVQELYMHLFILSSQSSSKKNRSFFYIGGNRASERLSNLFKVTQLANGGAKLLINFAHPHPIMFGDIWLL